MCSLLSSFFLWIFDWINQQAKKCVINCTLCIYICYYLQICDLFIYTMIKPFDSATCLSISIFSPFFHIIMMHLFFFLGTIIFILWFNSTAFFPIRETPAVRRTQPFTLALSNLYNGYMVNNNNNSMYGGNLILDSLSCIQQCTQRYLRDGK